MTLDEIIERGFSLTDDGRVLNEFGHEYRDEQGCVCYLESDHG